MRTTGLSAGARRLVFLFLGCLLSGSAFADRHSLWVAKGKHNTVYLLGSMHLLRASEPLPAVMDDAYRDAEKLVMELDLDDLDLFAAQQLSTRLGLFPEGETLTDQLDRETTAKLEAYAKRIDVPLSMLSRFKPWFAAITLTQLHLLKLGLDPQSGIEQRFATKAAADGKEIAGLETLEEQLHLLADLPLPLQAQFLMQSVGEGDELEKEIDRMIAAWRTGDARALEQFGTRDLRKFPKLHATLLVDRNRRWLRRLETMFEAKDDYLVIVGALHLVGKDGVIDLLTRKGYVIEQL